MGLIFKSKNGNPGNSDEDSGKGQMLKRFQSLKETEIPEGVDFKVVRFLVHAYQSCGCGGSYWKDRNAFAIVPSDFEIDQWKSGEGWIHEAKLGAAFGRFSVYEGVYNGKPENFNEKHYDKFYTGR